MIPDTDIFNEDKMKSKYLSFTLLSIICVCLSGCASQQLNPIGKAYQRNQCLQIPDKAASDRCLSDLDQYERDSRPDNK
jgi:hypothetical protein